MLLQILEDGHLTDAKGRRVDFRNTIIIMTSNVGAKSLLKDTSLGFRPVSTTEDQEREKQYDRMKVKVLDQLKSQFRPEFLNRVDSLVVFRSLTVEEIRLIVDLLLARVRDQLRAQQIDLVITQEAKDHIIKLGYDVDYGARVAYSEMVRFPRALLLGASGDRRGIAARVRTDHRAAARRRPSRLAAGGRAAWRAGTARSARPCPLGGSTPRTWNSLVETLARPIGVNRRPADRATLPPLSRATGPAVPQPDRTPSRRSTVLGSGPCPVRSSQWPGIGKSTLVCRWPRVRPHRGDAPPEGLRQRESGARLHSRGPPGLVAPATRQAFACWRPDVTSALPRLQAPRPSLWIHPGMTVDGLGPAGRG
jgi:hypothetical protein